MPIPADQKTLEALLVCNPAIAEVLNQNERLRTDRRLLKILFFLESESLLTRIEHVDGVLLIINNEIDAEIANCLTQLQDPDLIAQYFDSVIIYLLRFQFLRADGLAMLAKLTSLELKLKFFNVLVRFVFPRVVQDEIDNIELGLTIFSKITDPDFLICFEKINIILMRNFTCSNPFDEVFLSLIISPLIQLDTMFLLLDYLCVLEQQGELSEVRAMYVLSVLQSYTLDPSIKESSVITHDFTENYLSPLMSYQYYDLNKALIEKFESHQQETYLIPVFGYSISGFSNMLTSEQNAYFEVTRAIPFIQDFYSKGEGLLKDHGDFYERLLAFSKNLRAVIARFENDLRKQTLYFNSYIKLFLMRPFSTLDVFLRNDYLLSMFCIQRISDIRMLLKPNFISGFDHLIAILNDMFGSVFNIDKVTLFNFLDIEILACEFFGNSALEIILVLFQRMKQLNDFSTDSVSSFMFSVSARKVSESNLENIQEIAKIVSMFIYDKLDEYDQFLFPELSINTRDLICQKHQNFCNLFKFDITLRDFFTFPPLFQELLINNYNRLFDLISDFRLTIPLLQTLFVKNEPACYALLTCNELFLEGYYNQSLVILELPHKTPIEALLANTVFSAEEVVLPQREDACIDVGECAATPRLS